jgi:sugar lactone lactonase YvrE
MVDRLFTMVKPESMRGLTISATAKRAAIGLMLITAAACQQGPVAPKITPTASPSPRASALAACPAATASPGPQVLLQKQPAPDDLAFDNDGRLLFSDITTGAVSTLNADGSVQRIAGGMSAPEGIIVQADGHILVAEQGRNRVVSIDPQTHAVTPWHAFPNRTGREGIDGIGPILPSLDSNGNFLPTADNVIVPDSPNGVVWRVSADGKTATQIASGMVRPVGAAVDSSRRIFVADEGGALWALTPARVRFATLPTPDDVLVGRAGHIFVNTLGDNAIHELDNLGHQIGVITGIQQPQGIALDGADNLYYTEFNTGRIDRVVRTFTLDTPKVTRTTRGTYIICPVIRRAAGFGSPLGLTTGSSLTTDILQLVQPGTDSSGALEVQTPEHSITIFVDTTDGGLNLGQSQTVPLSP